MDGNNSTYVWQCEHERFGSYCNGLRVYGYERRCFGTADGSRRYIQAGEPIFYLFDVTRPLVIKGISLCVVPE